MNDILLVLYKRLLSYTRKTWSTKDYPLRYRNQEPPAKAWVVQIIHWWTLTGLGDTKEEANLMLAESLENYRKSHSSLPRPGCKVPVLFADTSIIDQLEPVAADFFDKILGYNYYECLISDESNLSDFGLDEEDVLRNIHQIYGLQLTDIGDGNIVRLLKYIENKTKDGY